MIVPLCGPFLILGVVFVQATAIDPRTLSLSTRKASQPLKAPFYGTSANGFTSAARGWDSFGMQKLASSASGGFTLTQASVQAQCDLLNVAAGYTYCSINSSWSANGGNEFGRIEPDTSAFLDLAWLADHLHDQGTQLGVYPLQGAFPSDAGVTVEGTDIMLGSLFDTSQTSYNLRQAFDYR